MRISDWSSDVCSSDLSNRPSLAQFVLVARTLTCTAHTEAPRGLLSWSGFRGASSVFGVDVVVQAVGGCVAALPLARSPSTAQHLLCEITTSNLRPGCVYTQRFAVHIDSRARARRRSEGHTSELQSLMRNSYAVFCLKKKTRHNHV